MSATQFWRPSRTPARRDRRLVSGLFVTRLHALMLAASIFGVPATCLAAAPAEKHVDVVQPCPDPITLHLRIARVDGYPSETTIPSCGLRVDATAEVPGATSLVIEGRHGALDVNLRLRDGEREASYRASVLPGLGEVRMERTGGGGPDVWAWSTRVSGGDFVVTEVVNMTASDLAGRVARAKHLRIDDVARYGKTRITFKFARVPLATVFALLADITEMDTRRVGPRHYVVRAQPQSPDLRELYAAVSGSEPEAVEAGWEKIVAFNGTPTRAEDVYAFHYHALATLGTIALGHRDFEKARGLFCRALALADLHDPGGHDAFYAGTVIKLAAAESHLGHQDAALALLASAQQIVTAIEGADGESMVGVLRGMGDVQHELHNGAAELALLDRALAIADPANDASFMSAQALRLVDENLLGRADALLQRIYPAIRMLDQAYQRFSDADRALARAYREQKRFADVERLDRREIALDTTIWGEDSTQTASSRYFLANDFLDQGRFSEAEAEMLRYIATDRDQPKLGVFRVDAIETLTGRRIDARDFAAAAKTWREMATLRAKALGAADPSVPLALRETAILYALSGDDASSHEVGAQAYEIETSRTLAPAVPGFAEDERDRKDAAETQLMPALAQQALLALRESAGSSPTGAQVARADRVATALGDYASACKDRPRAIKSYAALLELVEWAHGRGNAETARIARLLAALYDDEGRTGDAVALRAKYRGR